MTCGRCDADRRPECFGQDRVCAFDGDGNFTADNWSCATIDALLCGVPAVVQGRDHRAELVEFSVDGLSGDCIYGFVVIHRYKQRGRASCAVVVADDYGSFPLTLRFAEAVIGSRGDE